MNSRLETIQQVAAGRLSLEAAAARHCVAPGTVVEWSELLIAAGHAPRRTSKPLAALVTVFALLGLAGAARAACNAPMFGNLIGVCADAPAVADDYNANLQRIDTRLNAGVTSDTQLRADLNTTINSTNAKVGPLGTTGVTLQAPTRFGGGVCAPNEVPVMDSTNAVDCRPLYGTAGSPIISAWETGDLYASGGGNNNNTFLLGSTASMICVLSDVRFADIDDSSEEARCLVEREAGNWVLHAIANGDSHAVCRARCIQFNF